MARSGDGHSQRDGWAVTMAEVTYSQAFQQGVQEEMDRNESIFVLGTDIYDRGGHFAQLKGLGERFGHDRVRDAPISEAAMVAAGVGAALNGCHPLVDLNFMDFAFGAMDEIINQAAKIRYMWGRPVPLVVRATAGVAGGGAQHNNSLQAWFASTPGLTVVFPSRAYDVKGLIKSALRMDDPVIFMMHKRLSGARGEAGGPDELVPIGSARVARAGNHVTVISYGYGAITATNAAEKLAADGVECDVIDLRTLYPLDVDTILKSVRRTGRVVVLDEAPRHGSLAAEIAATIQEEAFFYLDQPVLRVTGAHVPIPHSPTLLEAVLPSEDDLVSAVQQLLAAGDG
jgi:pyruvate/2-oxoglutarate/acetoin dehydrogenase E1 component